MATKKKVVKKEATTKTSNKVIEALLKKIATGGENGIQCSEKEPGLVELIESKMVEVGAVDKTNGNLLVRCTAAGFKHTSIETGPAPEPSETPVEAAPVQSKLIEIDDGIEMASVRRGSKGSRLYPFEQMEVGQSFHVAATEEKPKPSKSLSSCTSNVNKRHKNGDEVLKKFAVRDVDSTDPKGAGARVFRII